MVTRLMANFVGEYRKPKPHFVIGVKHDPKVIYQLLFETKEARNSEIDGLERVYASFPITLANRDRKLKSEVDTFRHSLHDRDDIIVFDPLTIQERQIVDLLGARPRKRFVASVDV